MSKDLVMNRINIMTSDDLQNEPYLEGWFDLDRAEAFREDTTWNGSNHLSVHTGSPFHHQTLYRTAGGRWVLGKSSNYQGTIPSYAFITADQAKTWLLVNHNDADVAKYFDAVEDERGPGRPAIGRKVDVRLDDATIAAADTRAAEQGTTRANVLRDIITAALTATDAAA